MSNGEDTAVKDAAAKDASHTGAPPVVPMGELGQMLITTPNSISANYYDLLKAVVIDQSLNADQKDALLKRLKSTNPTSDRLTYRLAIAILGVIAVVSIVAIWWITLKSSVDVKVPDGLIAVASGAVGGLAGLLSQPRSGDTHNQA